MINEHSPKQSRHTRRGAMALFVAAVISVLLIILGFSVDFAQMQRARTELQVATDLAAKAACAELADTGRTSKAISAGKAIAAANRVANAPLQLASSDFVFGRISKSQTGRWTFAAAGTPTNAVQITGDRSASSGSGSVPLFFSGFLGYAFEPTTVATAAFVDVDICLVLDRSSSMKFAVNSTQSGMYGTDPRACVPPMADSRWIALEDSVGMFVAQLQTTLADEKMAVVTFASGDVSFCGEVNTIASTDQVLTKNLGRITTAMAVRSSSVWNGNTMILEGLAHARNLMRTTARPMAERVIVLFTDGVYTSGDPVPEALAAYQQDNITVHTITFGVGASQDDMQDVAAAGNGRHYHAPDAASLNDVFFELAGAITILTD